MKTTLSANFIAVVARLTSARDGFAIRMRSANPFLISLS